MDAATLARFAKVDEYIAETDRRLENIARQNAALGEMVEVLGSYVNATLDRVQRHVEDDH